MCVLKKISPARTFNAALNKQPGFHLTVKGQQQRSWLRRVCSQVLGFKQLELKVQVQETKAQRE